MSEKIEPVDPPPGPSELASKVQRVKQAALAAAERRARLPVPLFWSLFHSQIREAKEVRQRNRALKKILLGIE